MSCAVIRVAFTYRAPVGLGLSISGRSEPVASAAANRGPKNGKDGLGKMAWFYIFFADIFEIAWPFVLKWSAPLSRWAPLFVGMICSVPINYLLAEAVKSLPAATVYATFVGIGTAGTAIVGIVFFAESTNIGRVCSLMLILVGLIGLKVFSGAAE
jgi:quaternary ammonium compound-resistance protein SugE